MDRYRLGPCPGPSTQCRIFDESDHLLPDDLVQQILVDRPAVANGTAQVAPAVRTQASVIVDLARRTAGRCAGKRVTAFSARHQSLHNARLDGSAGCEALVILQPFCRQREGFFSDDGRNWNLNPLVAGALVASGITASRLTREPQRLGDLLPRPHLRLAEASCTLVGGIAQHPPYHRAFPAGHPSARRNVRFPQQSAIAPMLRPSTVYFSNTIRTTSTSAASIS